MTHQFIAQADVELFGRHRLERGEGDVARRACDGVHGSYLLKEILNAVNVGNIDAMFTSASPRRDDLVTLGELRGNRLADCAMGTDEKNFHGKTIPRSQ